MNLEATYLGAVLDGVGYTVTLLPSDTGDDFLYATWFSDSMERITETIEVTYKDGVFLAAEYGWTDRTPCTCDTCRKRAQSNPTQTPAGKAHYSTVKDLLNELSITLGGPEGYDDVEAWPLEIAPGIPFPEVRRDDAGRIVGDPVRVGDVWACYCQPQWGRTFRIVEVNGEECVGEVLTDSLEVRRQLLLAREGDTYYSGARSTVGNRVWIKLSRMRPTADGYFRLDMAAAA